MDIPLLCPTCEWGETDPSDVDFEVFNGSDINFNADIAIDIETVIEHPTSTGLSFADINVNSLDVGGHIDEIRYIFQNKPYNIIGINKTQFTQSTSTNNLNIDDYELLRAEHKIQGKRVGGGCALYIRGHVVFNEKPELISDELEGICGYVTFPNKVK